MKSGIVFLEVPQGHDGFLAYLNLVDEEKRLARYDGDGKRTAEFLARVPHVDVLCEQLSQAGLLFKVYLHKVAELLAEFSHGSGLAHLPLIVSSHRFTFNFAAEKQTRRILRQRLMGFFTGGLL